MWQRITEATEQGELTLTGRLTSARPVIGSVTATMMSVLPAKVSSFVKDLSLHHSQASSDQYLSTLMILATCSARAALQASSHAEACLFYALLQEYKAILHSKAPMHATRLSADGQAQTQFEVRMHRQ